MYSWFCVERIVYIYTVCIAIWAVYAGHIHDVACCCNGGRGTCVSVREYVRESFV